MRRDAFLRSQKLMRLATADAAGAPHVVPVWYRYAGGRFLVGTSLRTRKARNVAENPRVSFCVDEGVSPPIRGVMGRGTASLLTGPAEVRRAAGRILLRYYETLEAPAARELLADTDCVIEISPDSMVAWRY